MSIRIELREDTLILALPQEFSLGQAHVVLDPVARLLAAGRVTALAIDMTDTRFVNAEGLSVLRTLTDLAEARGAPATAVVPNVHLRRLLRVLDLDQGMNLTEHWPADSSAAPRLGTE